MRVSQRRGTRWRRNRYSISVPGAMAMGAGVTMRKPSDAGVMASRFEASAKNPNASAGGAGRSCSRERVFVFMKLGTHHAAAPSIGDGRLGGVLAMTVLV